MRGKTIVIEGTDCSGKETQSKLLIERLNNVGATTEYYSFPNYDKPTGEIIGLSYLGKPYLAERLIENMEDEIMKLLNENYSVEGVIGAKEALRLVKEKLAHGWFKEGATNVDPKVASLYYTADRMYCMPEINEILDEGKNIILDRYSYSNFGHQASKYEKIKDRFLMYDWLESLEFRLAELPEADVKIFLHMPTAYTSILKHGRKEKLDEHEVDTDFLKRSENAFLEMADLYDFNIIKCVNERESEPSILDIKSKDEISNEVYDVVVKELKLK